MNTRDSRNRDLAAGRELTIFKELRRAAILFAL